MELRQATIQVIGLNNLVVYGDESQDGWNFTQTWEALISGQWPGKDSFMNDPHFLRFKSGESWENFPIDATVDVQLEWLKAREVKWYPEVSAKPVFLFDVEALEKAETIEDFLRISRLKLEDAARADNSFERADYLKMGFSLEMSAEEFFSLGKKRFYGFSDCVVRRALENEVVTYTWKNVQVKWNPTSRRYRRKGGIRIVAKEIRLQISSGKDNFVKVEIKK